VKLEIKQMAKRGDQKTARILAKQIVQSRKAKERMYTSKAELHSISLALTHQLGTLASRYELAAVRTTHAHLHARVMQQR
jgi:division protein CdvB (Snf7/Vps24/ESCRT-III family)